MAEKEVSNFSTLILGLKCLRDRKSFLKNLLKDDDEARSKVRQSILTQSVVLLSVTIRLNVYSCRLFEKDRSF